MVVTLLNLCDVHDIVAENLLNLLNGFHLAIAKLLAKCDANQRSSRSIIFAQNNDAKCAGYTLSLTQRLHVTDAVCWQEKSTRAHEGTLHLLNTAHLLCFISFRGKKSRWLLFEQTTYEVYYGV